MSPFRNSPDIPNRRDRQRNYDQQANAGTNQGVSKNCIWVKYEPHSPTIHTLHFAQFASESTLGCVGGFNAAARVPHHALGHEQIHRLRRLLHEHLGEGHDVQVAVEALDEEVRLTRARRVHHNMARHANETHISAIVHDEHAVGDVATHTQGLVQTHGVQVHGVVQERAVQRALSRHELAH